MNVIHIGVRRACGLDFNFAGPQIAGSNMPAAEAASTVPTRSHLDALFAKIDPIRARLIFALDATMSRQPTWDMAAKLTAELFGSAAAIGGLEIQLVYYRGPNECTASRWLPDAKSLASIMSGIMCRAGETQIRKVLGHAKKESAQNKVGAVILISDACEERPADLYNAARELHDVPVFLFQEGNDEHVSQIYGQIADLTHGAVAKFDAGAAQRLADLLRAVATFAAGGVKALADQNSEAARLLLTQIKK